MPMRPLDPVTEEFSYVTVEFAELSVSRSTTPLVEMAA